MPDVRPASPFRLARSSAASAAPSCIAACALLGVAAVEHGGHPDGALAAAEPDVVIGEIVAFLRRERPEVVLTFGPEGRADRPPRSSRDLPLRDVGDAARRHGGLSRAARRRARPHRADAALLSSPGPTPPPAKRLGTEGQPIEIRVAASRRGTRGSCRPSSRIAPSSSTSPTSAAKQCRRPRTTSSRSGRRRRRE